MDRCTLDFATPHVRLLDSAPARDHAHLVVPCAYESCVRVQASDSRPLEVCLAYSYQYRYAQLAAAAARSVRYNLSDGVSTLVATYTDHEHHNSDPDTCHYHVSSRRSVGGYAGNSWAKTILCPQISGPGVVSRVVCLQHV